MTSRTIDLFHHLLSYLQMCDTELYDYYLSITTDESGELYPELVTSSVLMELECSVKNCIM
jgi:hypothetical protein